MHPPGQKSTQGLACPGHPSLAPRASCIESVSQHAAGKLLERTRRRVYTLEMPAPNLRRHRRIECDRPAIFEVATPSGPERCPATVRALSMGGLGLAFDEWDIVLAKAGDTAIVRLPVDTGALVLPVRVAWIRHDPSARFDLGVVIIADRIDHATAAGYQALLMDPVEPT